MLPVFKKIGVSFESGMLLPSIAGEGIKKGKEKGMEGNSTYIISPMHF